jgi:OTU domain-containing protein 6
LRPDLLYEPEDAQPSDASPLEAVRRYCARPGSHGRVGGHAEIRALAATLGLPVVVHQVGAPPMRVAPEGDAGGPPPAGPPEEDHALRVSFHRHYLSLGEHYNSVVPKKATDKPWDTR